MTKYPPPVSERAAASAQIAVWLGAAALSWLLVAALAWAGGLL